MNHVALAIGTQFFSSGGNASGVFGRSNLEGIGWVVSTFLRGAFVIAGLILLFYFLAGGIAMIGSAGKDDPKAAAGAKASITTALIGFIVVILAYTIVKLIATLIGVPNII